MPTPVSIMIHSIPITTRRLVARRPFPCPMAALATLTVGFVLLAVSPDLTAGQPGPGQEVVRYSDFGAAGDGETDDMQAIADAHAFANEHGLPVKADDDATYYVGGAAITAVIQTDTDFGSARFIIDDTDVEDRTAHVFDVTSSLPSITLDGIGRLGRDQPRIDVSLERPAVVIATNTGRRQYIRHGRNRNDGSSQTDVFLVDRDGGVHEDTPILWDFDQVTRLTAYPVDDTVLTISGGRFTTIANAAESRYTYYSRGILIRRSRVVVEGIEHRVTGEGEQGAPYRGFLNIRRCADVTVRDSVFTGRRTYGTIGAAGQPVSMGSYDISLNRALNVTFVNCRQTNDIDDRTYWGLMGSNYCKNLVLDNCSFSRFDAHMGVHNVVIRGSTLGHQGINAIGSGTVLLEDTTVRGRHLVNLRPDYGSTWRGEVIIRNCVFVPAGGRPIHASLIGGTNRGQHDFGYTCHMPERVVIDTLHIDDSNQPADYRGPAIFANFNPGFTEGSPEPEFPQVVTREVVLRDVTTASGKDLRLSDNTYLFRDVEVTR